MAHKHYSLDKCSVGEVTRCLICDTLNIEVGNCFVQGLSIPEFSNFKTKIEQISLNAVIGPKAAKICISLIKGKVNLSLSFMEFFEFLEMLERAAGKIPWLRTQSC